MINELHTPLSVALVFGYYYWYAVPSWSVAIVRAFRRRMTKKEALLLAIFCALVLIEAFQLALEGNFLKREVWGLPRYFSVFGPLLWVWMAWGIAALLRVSRKVVRGISVGVLVVFVAFLCGNECVRFFVQQFQFSDNADAMRAAERIKPYIRADYCGPARLSDFKYLLGEYFTSRRPVIFGNYGAAAWALRGQSEGANLGMYSYQPDYLFLNMDRGGYRGAVEMTPDDFDIITQVRGTTCRWALFRRKGVPHR